MVPHVSSVLVFSLSSSHCRMRRLAIIRKPGLHILSDKISQSLYRLWESVIIRLISSRRREDRMTPTLLALLIASCCSFVAVKFYDIELGWSNSLRKRLSTKRSRVRFLARACRFAGLRSFHFGGEWMFIFPHSPILILSLQFPSVAFS